MAWDHSAVFATYLAGVMRPDPPLRRSWVDAATRLRVAVFNGTGTPDRNAPADAARYGAGEWVTAREMTDPSSLPAGGVASGLTASAAMPAEPVAFLTLARPAPLIIGPAFAPVNGPAAGTLVYDPVGAAVDQAVAYHWFGGPVPINGGTLTITWPAAPDGAISLQF